MAALNYTVDVRYPDIQVIAVHVSGQPIYRDRAALDQFEDQRDWCEANIKGQWSAEVSTGNGGIQIFDANGNQTYGQNLSLRHWSFEREEDAALFKLFWY